MKIIIRQNFLILTLVIISFIGFIGYFIYKTNLKLLDSVRWVQHTEQVVTQTARVLFLCKDLEIASRGFVITNDTSFLEPLNNAEKTSAEYFGQLKQLTIENPIQQKRIDELNLYMQKRLSFSMEMVEIRKTLGFASATAYYAANPDRHYTDRIRRIIFDIQHEENILLEQRRQTNQVSILAFSRFSILMFILMAIFTVVLFMITGNYFYQNREKGKRAAELKIAGKELAFQNKEKGKRAAELIIADKELLFQNNEKEKRAAELTIANKELIFQNEEKEKRAAELTIANQELLFQNKEKVKRAAELIIANSELLFQNNEKEKRAEELIIANKELVKVEAQIEFDKNNLMALINNAKDLMWSVDKDFKLITSNEHFDHSLLLMTGKILKRGSNVLSASLPTEQLNRFKLNYNRAFAGESFTEIEYSDAPIKFWSEISFYPIRKGDEIIGTACHSHDITERKLAEIERIEITNDLLQRNHALEQFTYIISHNLRSPVANIAGISHSICHMKLTQETENRMKVNLIASVKKLDEVIKDISQILQIKQDVSEQKEIVLFSKLFTDIQLSIDSLIKKEDVIFISNFTEIDEMLTFKSYLYSIFFNIILNSIKYRQTNISPIIEITSKKDGYKTVLIFKDNGLGIDLEKWGDQVFGLYKRFHFHTEGKGMGLYMVKTQVEKLHGKIFINSRVNKGIEFRIEFNTE